MQPYIKILCHFTIQKKNKKPLILLRGLNKLTTKKALYLSEEEFPREEDDLLPPDLLPDDLFPPPELFPLFPRDELPLSLPPLELPERLPEPEFDFGIIYIIYLFTGHIKNICHIREESVAYKF
jgi:hypothetical protein